MLQRKSTARGALNATNGAHPTLQATHGRDAGRENTEHMACTVPRAVQVRLCRMQQRMQFCAWA